MADIETKPTITITQEEYKELLLKAEAPHTSDMIVDAIHNLIGRSGKVVEPGTYEETACGIAIDYTNGFAKNVITILHVIDPEGLSQVLSKMLAKQSMLDLLEDLKKKAEEEKKEEAE